MQNGQGARPRAPRVATVLSANASCSNVTSDCSVTAQGQQHVEVLAEDQARINMFSRLHMKMQELERNLKSYKVGNARAAAKRTHSWQGICWALWRCQRALGP